MHFARLARSPEVALVALLALASTLPLDDLYGDRRLLALTGGACALAVVASFLLAPLRPRLVSVLAMTAAAYAYLALLVLHGWGPATLWRSVTRSWSTLLTSPLPVPVRGVPGVLPVLLAVTATYMGAEIAQRTGWTLGPVLPAIGSLVVTLLFTGSLALPAIWWTGLLVLLVVAIALLRARRHQQVGEAAGGGSGGLSIMAESGAPVAPGVSPAAALTGLASLVVIALAAAGLGALLPLASNSRRVDLRQRYQPPISLESAVSPLAELQSQLNSTSTTPLFTVRFTGIPAGVTVDRVPIAILDHYDGVVWGTAATFALAGARLPAGPPPVQPGSLIHQDYRIGTYSLSFLPTLARPTAVTGTSLLFDRTDGMLATASPAASGFSYGVDSQVPDESRIGSEPVKPGIDPEYASLSQPPPQGWPAPILTFANQVAASSPYATLQGLVQELRSPAFGYSTTAQPGHSLGVLGDFLTPPTRQAQTATARVGYAEQFAASFALFARIRGFASRVIVGYRVDPAAAASGQTIAVVPGQIHAWVQVELNNVGWVTFDPTNNTARTSTVPPPAAPPPPAVGVHPGTAGKAAAVAQTAAAPRHRLAWWALAPLLVAVPGAVSGAKLAKRRWRARRGPVVQRVMGAWREARDHLQAFGANPLRSLTPEELATRVGERLGPEVAVRLAAFVPVLNTTLYAPAEPEESAVEAAWAAELGVREILRDQASLPQRVLLVVDPRPLVRVGDHRRAGR